MVREEDRKEVRSSSNMMRMSNVVINRIVDFISDSKTLSDCQIIDVGCGNGSLLRSLVSSFCLFIMTKNILQQCMTISRLFDHLSLSVCLY